MSECTSNLCHELYVEFVHSGVHTRFAAFVEKGFFSTNRCLEGVRRRRKRVCFSYEENFSFYMYIHVYIREQGIFHDEW